MVPLAIAIVVGLVGRQRAKYWRHLACAFALHVAAFLNFAGGGTVEDPTGDGFLTAMIRARWGDGGVIVVFPFVMLFGWVAPIWLLRRGYEKPERRNDPAFVDPQ